MNTNSPKKSSAKKNVPERPINLADEKKEGVPPGLEILAHAKDLSPLQLITMVSPKFAEAQKSENATEVIERMAGLFWGIGIDLGVPLPEWAKTASEKFHQSFGLSFLREIQNGQPAAIGKMVELMDIIPKSDNPSPLENGVLNLVKLAKNDCGNMSAKELREYADGRMAAPKIIEKAKNPSERIMVFLFIACAWRDIEKLGSRIKTYKWLKEKKLISPYTEWDEVKDWLKEVDIPKGKAGRPKGNRDTDKKIKSGL